MRSQEHIRHLMPRIELDRLIIIVGNAYCLLFHFIQHTSIIISLIYISIDSLVYTFIRAISSSHPAHKKRSHCIWIKKKQICRVEHYQPIFMFG